MGKLIKLLGLTLLLSILSIANARENTNLTEIYTEFTETVTVQYSKMIKVKQSYANIQHDISVTEILHYWNNVVNTRDTDALFNLYAPKVLYYGQDLKDRSCINDKKRFYKKYPFFRQSVDNIKVINISQNLYKVYFDKYVKMKESGKIKNYPSYIVIGYINQRPYVYVEGDSITDKNLLKKYRKQ